MGGIRDRVVVGIRHRLLEGIIGRIAVVHRHMGGRIGGEVRLLIGRRDVVRGLVVGLMEGGIEPIVIHHVGVLIGKESVGGMIGIK